MRCIVVLGGKGGGNDAEIVWGEGACGVMLNACHGRGRCMAVHCCSLGARVPCCITICHE